MKLRLIVITLFICSLALLNAPASEKVRMVLIPDSHDYFAVPYPNDMHRYPDGRVDRRNFPVPGNNPLSKNYRRIADGMDGFGVTESVFIRFSGPLPGLTLPGIEESVRSDSPLFLVNIDDKSPAYGKRVPVYSYFHTHKSGPLQNLLAISPYPGFVLRENTIYAALVMTGLHPALAPAEQLAHLMRDKIPRSPAGVGVYKAYKPLKKYLADEGISMNDVAAATVYTTGDPTRPMRSIMDYVEKMTPLELDNPPAPYRDHKSFYALKSSFTAPQFQTGKGSQLVYGGKVIFDDKGAPIVQREESIPVKIMVPKGKMPPGGFPLLIYLHGGGNNSDEFLDHIILPDNDGFTPGEGPARVYAEQNIAGVSMAIVKSPERYSRFGSSGRTAEVPFYNFTRGDVLNANHWQAAADAAMLLRLMRGLSIDAKLCPKTDASASEDGRIRFDAKLFFASGFSMGGTILGMWAGVEPGIIASIPSGASGHWGMLIRNFTAVPAKPKFFAWITNGKPDEAMDARWPTMSLIQSALEPSDTITFAPHVFKRPFPGHPARHVYLALGKNDFYTKPLTQNAIATALELPLAGNVVEPSILPSQRLLGFDRPAEFPLSANVRSEDGRAVTAAVLQWEPDSWTNEGHNVNYNLTETKHQYGCFLRTLIDTGSAIIPPPAPEGSPCTINTID